jgi:hypothetical protein
MAQRKQTKPLKTATRARKTAKKVRPTKAKKKAKKTPNVLRSQWAELPLAQDNQAFGSDFSGALDALKQGYRVARDGWNGVGQYAFLVPAKVWKLDKLTNSQKRLIGKKQLPLLLRNAQGQVVQWGPSTGDLLADDWYVY